MFVITNPLGERGDYGIMPLIVHYSGLQGESLVQQKVHKACSFTKVRR